MKYISWKWVWTSGTPKVLEQIIFGGLGSGRYGWNLGISNWDRYLCSISLYSKSLNFSILVNYGQIAFTSVAYHHEVGLLVYPCHQKSSCRFRSRSQYLISIQWFCSYRFISNKPWWYLLNSHSDIINLYHHDFVHFWWSKWFYQFISVHIIWISHLISLRAQASSSWWPQWSREPAISDLMAWWDLTFRYF
jgi:hypothetical protein